jgi:hypothetical protein
MAQLRERRSCFAREMRASRLALSSLPLRTSLDHLDVTLALGQTLGLARRAVARPASAR